MDTVPAKRKNIRSLPFLCVMISIGLLLAGLWPFNFFPINNVRWLSDQEALRFGRYGIACSQQPVVVPGETLDFRKPITIELKLRSLADPVNSTSRILSICDDHSRELFFVGQWKNHLIIKLANVRGSSVESYRETGIDNLFRKNEPVTVGIRSDRWGTSLFADNRLMVSKAGYSLSRLSGVRTRALLLLGNSPTGQNPWEGDLLALSIHQDIDPTEITQGDVMTFAQSKKESGALLRTGGKIPLEFFIPSTYRPIKKTVLLHPWEQTRYNRSFWKDVIVNILGFIPFGFFFYGVLRESSPGKDFSTVLLVVAIGAGISLAIELLQVFLPTRDSSLTDVINNIMGTSIGVWLFRKGYRIIFA